MGGDDEMERNESVKKGEKIYTSLNRSWRIFNKKKSKWKWAIQGRICTERDHPDWIKFIHIICVDVEKKKGIISFPT